MPSHLDSVPHSFGEQMILTGKEWKLVNRSYNLCLTIMLACGITTPEEQASVWLTLAELAIDGRGL